VTDRTRASVRLLPIALLIVVASVQIALARTAALTPWKGGGFGMFSTLDHGVFRRIDVVIDAPGRSEGLIMPASLEATAARAAACPTDWLLRTLSEGIASRERRHARPVTRVTLTVWATDFDRGTLLAADRPVRTFVYDVP
jgi:hypothetical protein